MKVLIVDDNPDDRKLLRYVLEAHGHLVLEAGNGEEGLQAALAQEPDLIVSDVLMPVMDGFQFLRSLRGSSTVPFVFHSAVYDHARDRQLADSLGADGYIVKPKDPAGFMEEIERILSQGRKPRGLEEDEQYLKRYTQVVASKLEEKVRQLEATLAECKRVEEALQASRRKLSRMAAELSLAQERERRRIAAELHDRTGQTLLLAKLKFEALVKKLAPPAEEDRAVDVRLLLDEAIADVRSLTQELNPPILAGAGLEKALDWLRVHMATDYGLRVEYEDDGSGKPLTEELRSVLYQAARELLINVVKHAGTDSARLTTAREGSLLALVVEDRGAGFDPGASPESWGVEAGYGLLAIRERMRYLGGDMTIESKPGRGTRISLRVPLELGEKAP